MFRSLGERGEKAEGDTVGNRRQPRRALNSTTTAIEEMIVRRVWSFAVSPLFVRNHLRDQMVFCVQSWLIQRE